MCVDMAGPLERDIRRRMYGNRCYTISDITPFTLAAAICLKKQYYLI